MTLIAAFRTKDAVAICADSQETVGDYRRCVQKISPICVSGYQLVIAGSGDADPIEGFIIRARRRFSQETLSPTIDRALFLLENELALFYASDLASEQSMKLFIAVSCPASREYKVWVSHRSFLKDLGEFELIGWDHPMYEVTASRMYRANMNLQQAAIAAVNVLVIGEESSNYIKGPFSLAIIREGGIWMETEKYINTLRGRLKNFEAYTNQILLACADTSIYSRDLHDALANFAVVAQKMHEEQINEAIAEAAKNNFEVNESISKVPPGILVQVGNQGKLTVRHDVNGIEEMTRKINETLSLRKSDEEPNL